MIDEEEFETKKKFTLDLLKKSEEDTETKPTSSSEAVVTVRKFVTEIEIYPTKCPHCNQLVPSENIKLFVNKRPWPLGGITRKSLSKRPGKKVKGEQSILQKAETY